MALSRGEYPPTILFGSLALDSHNMGFGAAQGCLLLETLLGSQSGEGWGGFRRGCLI